MKSLQTMVVLIRTSFNDGFYKIQLSLTDLVRGVPDLREGLVKTSQLPNDHIDLIEQMGDVFDGVHSFPETVCQLAEHVLNGTVRWSIGGARLNNIAIIGLNSLENNWTRIPYFPSGGKGGDDRAS